MNESQALQRLEPMPVAPSVEAMITLAIERGASVEALERLMAIRREVRAEQAKAAYDRAMAAFQSECPIIEKTKAVSTNSGKVAYKYAPIESIVAQVKGLLQKHGFSYSTKMELHDKGVKSTVRVTHEAGHNEESPMEVPFGEKTQIMSQSQVAAAATTFAKRYAFLNAFGILTGDEDIDGHTDSVKKEEPKAPAKEPAKPVTAKVKPLQEPDEAARLRWVNMLKPLGQAALDYAYDQSWLIPPTDSSPGEPIEVLDLKHVPRTKRQASEILAEIQSRMDGQKPAGASGPPSTSAPPAKDAGKAAKQAPTPLQSASGEVPDEQPWFSAVVPVPYAGMKRAEYLKRPDTIGELYNLRHDDDQARRRLFGFLHNFQPKGWTNQHGNQMPPSAVDLKFRDDLDAFGEWFEENHPDEVKND